MLIEGQKVIDIIEGHKGFGINGILENIVEDIDNLCSDWEKMGLNINRRDDMKIGDEVYIHGYVDEIRKDTVIIRNDGGYFGTIPSEIIGREPKTDVLDKIRAEIKQLPYQRIFGNVSSYSLLDTVIEIIDKYRQEGEA